MVDILRSPFLASKLCELTRGALTAAFDGKAVAAKAIVPKANTSRLEGRIFSDPIARSPEKLWDRAVKFPRLEQKRHHLKDRRGCRRRQLLRDFLAVLNSKRSAKRIQAGTPCATSAFGDWTQNPRRTR